MLAKTIYSEDEKWSICDWAMSGIEIPRVIKEKGTHMCTSCMNSVIQTFGYLREQIKALRNEKANLQEETKKLRKAWKEEIWAMAEEIRALQKEVATLKKKLEFSREAVGSVA